MTRMLLVGLLAAACGPASPGDTDAPATTDAPGSTSATTTTTATTTTSDTGDVPTSPLSSDTTPPTTTGTTTGTTGDTTGTTGDTTSADSTTTGDPDVQYAAFFFAGGLDHVMIHKADFANDRCTTLHIARPTMGDPIFAITIPDEWGPQSATVTMGTAGCLEGMPVDPGVAATTGVGAILWPPDPMQLCPQQIDLDLTLEFPQDLPWVPAKDALQISNLPVQGCP
jgi:hypothetical protein